MRKVPLLLATFFVISACTKSENEVSRLKIQLPQRSLETASIASPNTDTQSSWGLEVPRTFSEISCYGIFVSAADFEVGNCSDSTGTSVFAFGEYTSAVAAGATLSVEVPVGSERTLRLVGYAAKTSADCVDLKTGAVTKENLSQGIVLNSIVTDLVVGDNEVSIEVPPTLSGTRIESCATALSPPETSTPVIENPPTGTPSESPATILGFQSVPSGAFAAGAKLSFSLEFSDTVVVTGTPKLHLTVGGVAKQANYVSGSGTSVLIFDFVADVSEGGVAIDGTQLDLAAGAIASASGTAASLMLPSQSLSVSIDNTAPTASSLSLDSGAVYTSSVTVSLTIAASDAYEMYITEDSTCGSGGSWQLYSTSATWALSALDTVATVAIKFRDQALNESSCISDTIVHDGTNPTPPMSFSLSSTQGDLSNSPGISYAPGTDANSVSHEIQVHQQSDNAIIQSWQPHTTGGALSGLSLTDGIAYYFRVRAKDAAGNVSTEAVSSAWTAQNAFVKMSVAQVFSCGVDSTNMGWCWGTNGSNGYLGNGSSTNELSAVAVSGGHSFALIDTYSSFSCGLTTAGAVYCWGAGSFGQLGNGASSVQQSPVAVLGGITFQRMSVGKLHVCGLDMSGSAHCWGRGAESQLGHGSTSGSNVPVAVSGGHSFVEIDAGKNTTCAVKADGSVYCWGDNTNGALGDGNMPTSSSVPVQVSGLTGVAKISVGGDTVCALKSDQSVVCWGLGTNGQIGNGGSTTINAPGSAVSGVSNFASIEVGDQHVCGITATADLYCWGNQGNGRVGNGISSGYANTPDLIGAGYVTVDSGQSHTCAVKTDGALNCWGLNSSGQLGTGSTGGSYNTPTPVDP